jgi:hypothetical protein
MSPLLPERDLPAGVAVYLPVREGRRKRRSSRKIERKKRKFHQIATGKFPSYEGILGRDLQLVYQLTSLAAMGRSPL